MLEVGTKVHFWCVCYLDKQSWKQEHFTDYHEALSFCRALKRSPDLIKAYVLYEIGTKVDYVKSLDSYEV